MKLEQQQLALEYESESQRCSGEAVKIISFILGHRERLCPKVF